MAERGKRAVVSSGTAKKPVRRRMPAAEREKMIVEGAIAYFAEVGFGGQTRELAQKLGITQPLIFQYFPSKEALIDRVYEEVYLQRWNPWWEELLEDRRRSLRERLIAFYHGYTRSIMREEWVRIILYSGLRGGSINRRYLSLVRERVIERICRELRAELELPTVEEVPLHELEPELVWANHGAFLYVGIRRWVYGLDTTNDMPALIEARIDSFLDGAAPTLRRLIAGSVENGAAKPRARRSA